jgi:hypothetical protein
MSAGDVVLLTLNVFRARVSMPSVKEETNDEIVSSANTNSRAAKGKSVVCVKGACAQISYTHAYIV